MKVAEFDKKFDEIHAGITKQGLIECPKCGNHVKVSDGKACGCGQVKWSEEKKGWIENVKKDKTKNEDSHSASCFLDD